MWLFVPAAFVLGFPLFFVLMLWCTVRKREAEKREILYAQMATLNALEEVDLFAKALEAVKGLVQNPEGKYVVELKGAPAAVFFHYLALVVKELDVFHVNFIANSQVSRANWRVTVYAQQHNLGCGKVKDHGFW